MAITTYAELLTAIQNYEDDATSVVSGIDDDMVTLAEQRIFMGFGSPGEPLYTPPLRCQAMEKTIVLPIGKGQDGGTAGGTANAITVTLASAPTIVRGLMITFTAAATNTGATTFNPNALGAVDLRKGKNRDPLEADDILSGAKYTVYYDGSFYVLLPSDGAVPLPSRFLGVKSAYLQDRYRVLTAAPESGLNVFMEGATSGIPEYYAVQDSCLRLDPLPSQDYKLVLNYYQRPAALSSALNDIFRDAPKIYLAGALLELALYLPNEAAIERHYGEFSGALKSYAKADRMAVQGNGPGRVRLAGIAP